MGGRGGVGGGVGGSVLLGGRVEGGRWEVRWEDGVGGRGGRRGLWGELGGRWEVRWEGLGGSLEGGVGGGVGRWEGAGVVGGLGGRGRGGVGVGACAAMPRYGAACVRYYRFGMRCVAVCDICIVETALLR